MREFKFLYIVLTVLCAATHLAAQTDSVPEVVRLHPDTFRLNEQRGTADIDLLLLDLVNKQSVELHEGDSAYALTPEEQMLIDSLQREEARIDSIRVMNAQFREVVENKIPTIEIEKSWIKDEVEDRNDVLRAIRNMKTPWRKEATVMVQVTQNYVTPNWYQGGSSSFAAMGIAKGQVNYISDRFTWENTGEWRMGGSTVSADTLHKVNTTDDMFRLYSKANLRVVPKIFASVSAEFETRFLPTYKSNSMEMKSAPFSPLRFNAAVGVDFKPVKDLSISVSPLAYKLIHVNDTVHVLATDYGLELGQRTQHNIGSSVRVEYKWKPVREVQLDGKFYMYTNYHHVELDLEINCDFIINRFFSARAIIHPRYDSSVIMSGDNHAKIQFREMISIGFAHKFR
ncbi:MAG: DUF3078 domain-containing protein [Paludibacteraceae bacterium]|nr:DUF3078 domain-containing protein [Paludibacteraceae bacterium]